MHREQDETIAKSAFFHRKMALFSLAIAEKKGYYKAGYCAKSV